ncbi:MAG TPA: type II toxin-antitoxin system PemK/MazF family toxin [Lachnospiraceae bacterium]|nr:type II toxin-antitoxin system PemK/MazF family toxin [Lachnospiraceae bacterium]
MTRGDIWIADFGVSFGSETGFIRPVIIVQNTKAVHGSRERMQK